MEGYGLGGGGPIIDRTIETLRSWKVNGRKKKKPRRMRGERASKRETPREQRGFVDSRDNWACGRCGRTNAPDRVSCRRCGVTDLTRKAKRSASQLAAKREEAVLRELRLPTPKKGRSENKFDQRVSMMQFMAKESDRPTFSRSKSERNGPPNLGMAPNRYSASRNGSRPPTSGSNKSRARLKRAASSSSLQTGRYGPNHQANRIRNTRSAGKTKHSKPKKKAPRRPSFGLPKRKVTKRKGKKGRRGKKELTADEEWKEALWKGTADDNVTRCMTGDSTLDTVVDFIWDSYMTELQTPGHTDDDGLLGSNTTDWVLLRKRQEAHEMSSVAHWDDYPMPLTYKPNELDSGASDDDSYIDAEKLPATPPEELTDCDSETDEDEPTTGALQRSRSVSQALRRMKSEPIRPTDPRSSSDNSSPSPMAQAKIGKRAAKFRFEDAETTAAAARLPGSPKRPRKSSSRSPNNRAAASDDTAAERAASRTVDVPAIPHRPIDMPEELAASTIAVLEELRNPSPPLARPPTPEVKLKAPARPDVRGARSPKSPRSSRSPRRSRGPATPDKPRKRRKGSSRTPLVHMEGPRAPARAARKLAPKSPSLDDQRSIRVKSKRIDRRLGSEVVIPDTPPPAPPNSRNRAEFGHATPDAEPILPMRDDIAPALGPLGAREDVDQPAQVTHISVALEPSVAGRPMFEATARDRDEEPQEPPVLVKKRTPPRKLPSPPPLPKRDRKNSPARPTHVEDPGPARPTLPPASENKPARPPAVEQTPARLGPAWTGVIPDRPDRPPPRKDAKKTLTAAEVAEQAKRRESRKSRSRDLKLVIANEHGPLRKKLVMRAIRVIRVAVKKKKNKANVIRFLTGKKLSKREIDLAYQIVDLNINAESITSDTWIKLSTWTKAVTAPPRPSDSPEAIVDKAFERDAPGHDTDARPE